jgi:hypothetical protein
MTIEISPVVEIDIDTETLPGATDAPADGECEAHTDDEGDELDDNALIHSMLCKAAADPDQPCLDHWHGCLGFEFSGKAVEDAYQAGQASGRALGVYSMAVLWAFWAFLSMLLQHPS